MATYRNDPYPEIAALLGGRRVLGAEPESRLDFAERVAMGLPAASVLRLKEALDLSDVDFARVLGISARTLARLKVGIARARETARRPAARAGGSHLTVVAGRLARDYMLDPSLSDRAYRVAFLLAQARALLGDAGAVQWLKSPQRGLAGRIPLDLVITEAGAREIEALLHRVGHGVYT